MEEEKIIDWYWERAENAVAETAIKYGKYCYAIAFNILSNRGDAEECQNDAYNALWNTIPPTRPKSLRAFLGRVTRNIALDKYKYNVAKKRNGEFDLILSELGDCVSSQNMVENEYESGEIAKAISNYLRTLDLDSRNIFLRRYWYSDSIIEISERFGISKSNVKSNLFRTRKKMKSFLEKRGVTI